MLDARILMTDSRACHVADIEVGAPVYGTAVEAGRRTYVPTTVTGLRPGEADGYRVCLADGTRLLVSAGQAVRIDGGLRSVVEGDHPPLQAGALVCGFGDTAFPVVTDLDYEYGYFIGLVHANGFRSTLDWDEYDYSYFFELGDPQVHQRMKRARFSLVWEGIFSKMVIWPEQRSPRWLAGFLAGVFDHDGNNKQPTLRLQTYYPIFIDRVVQACATLGFAADVEPGDDDKLAVTLAGGLADRLRFVHTVQPACTPEHLLQGATVEAPAGLRVVAVEPIGARLPLVEISTGTGDVVANGVVILGEAPDHHDHVTTDRR